MYLEILKMSCLICSYSDGLSITLKSANEIIFKIIVIYRPPNNDFTSFLVYFLILLFIRIYTIYICG